MKWMDTETSKPVNGENHRNSVSQEIELQQPRIVFSSADVKGEQHVYR